MHSILMISTLLLQLVRGVWLMEPNSASAYFPVVKAILSNSQVNLNSLIPQNNAQQIGAKEYGDWHAASDRYNREGKCMALQMESNMVRPSYYYGFDKAPKNSISLIPVHDVIMKYDNCGSPGTTTLARWLTEADQHPNIIGHIISIDSPGGSANGTSDFSSLILSLEKPVVVYCHGMMCSAAYWIGSSGRELIISNNTAVVGSIGTYLTLEDWSAALEAEGIKVHEIYATKSKDKNADVREAFAGNYKPILEDIIDPINESFLSAVKKNRYGKGMKANEVLTGKVFTGQAAIDVGLVDKIGTLADAVKSIQKFSKS